MYLAKRLGRKVVTLSQTISVTEPVAADAVGQVYRRLDLHLVREPISRERLIALGVSPERIAVCPDFAFAAEYNWREAGVVPPPPGSLALILRGDRPVDTVGWRSLLHRLESEGRQVSALSTCPAHDLPTLSRIAVGTRLRVAPRAREVADFLRQLRSCEMVITDRFHGAILALLAGLPVLPLESTTFKMKGLFRLFDYPAEVLPPLSRASYDGLTHAIDEFTKNLPAARLAASAAGRALADRVATDVPSALAGAINIGGAAVHESG